MKATRTKTKPTEHERYLVRLVQARAKRRTYPQLLSYLRGFVKPERNSKLLRWKFNKILREKRDGK